MSKYGDEEEDFIVQDGNKYFNSSLLRSEHEFYKEDEDVKHKVVNVRRAKLRKGEDWEILEDGKVVLILKGVRFTNQEKEFFRTVDGMKFIIEGYKNGWDSVLRFKNELKVIIK